LVNQLCAKYSVNLAAVRDANSGMNAKMKRFWKLDLLLGTLLLSATVMGSSILTPAPVSAKAGSDAVTLTSAVAIERVETDAAGKEQIVLKSPKDVMIVPGDRVVFTLEYNNEGKEPATGFRATNPMPGPVQFTAVTEDWAEVSVDGGKSWGKLATLTVPSKSADGADSMRAASPQDVTHVRWVFADAIAPGGQGSVSYRGVIK
jgi:hypothetical protein